MQKFRAALRGECGGAASAGSDASSAATGPSAAGPCTCATICGSVGRSVSVSRLAAVIITLVTHLIGHGDEQGEEEDVAVPGVVASDVLGRSRGHAPGQVGQRHGRGHEIVAVGLDEIVTRDGCRIDVVFSKRADKVLSEEQRNVSAEAGARGKWADRRRTYIEKPRTRSSESGAPPLRWPCSASPGAEVL
jgi:hypothetical protein